MIAEGPGKTASTVGYPGAGASTTSTFFKNPTVTLPSVSFREI